MKMLALVIYDQADTGCRHVAVMTEEQFHTIEKANVRRKQPINVKQKIIVECDLLTVEDIHENIPIVMLM